MNYGIVGSRDYPHLNLVTAYIDTLPPEAIVVSGAGGDVDKTAEAYANERGLRTIAHPADWDRHGKSAGPIRNSKIVEDSNFVIAFWDGVSRGTGDTVKKARDANKFLGYFDFEGVWHSSNRMVIVKRPPQ